LRQQTILLALFITKKLIIYIMFIDKTL